MSINYKPLFTLKLKHNYYVDGWAKGLVLMPSSSTQKRMKSHRMLFRNGPYGAVVLYRAMGDDGQPFVVLPEKFKFTFTLFADSPKQFFNITKTEAAGSASGSPTFQEINGANGYQRLYFYNDGTNKSLLSSQLDGIEPPVFSVRFKADPPAASAQFRVADSDGAFVSFSRDVETGQLLDELAIKPVDQAHEYFEQQLSMEHLPEGRYELQVDGNRLASRYVSKDLATVQLIAIVEINLQKPGTGNHGLSFELEFERRYTYWKYRIVNKSKLIDLVGKPPVIALKKTDLPLPPLPPPPSAYLKSASKVDFEAAVQETEASKKVQGLETWNIVSKASLPFYEFPLLNLELLSDGKIRFDQLPSTSSATTVKWNIDKERYESEIYVFV